MPSDILPPTTQSSKAPLSVLLLLAFAPCSAIALLYCLHRQLHITTQGAAISSGLKRQLWYAFHGTCHL